MELLSCSITHCIEHGVIRSRCAAAIRNCLGVVGVASFGLERTVDFAELDVVHKFRMLTHAFLEAGRNLVIVENGAARAEIVLNTLDFVRFIESCSHTLRSTWCN